MRLLSSPAFIFGGVLSVRAAFPAWADESASPPEPADVAVGLVDTLHPRFCIDVCASLIRLKARHPQYLFRSEERPPGKPVDPSKFGANGFVILSSGDAVRGSDPGWRRASRGAIFRSNGPRPTTTASMTPTSKPAAA